MTTTTPTTDLCDAYGDRLDVLEPVFLDFGGLASFAGIVTTLQVFEDNSLVRDALGESGDGKVLVIDGGRSTRCALVGGNLAKLAETNRWAGIVVWGAIRDVLEMRSCQVGVRALASNPRKSVKQGKGQRDVPVQLAGVTVHPGHWLVADADGIILSPARL